VTLSENDVLDLLKQGFSNKEIAERLGITERTVKNRLLRIYAQFGVRSARQLLARELVKVCK